MENSSYLSDYYFCWTRWLFYLAIHSNRAIKAKYRTVCNSNALTAEVSKLKTDKSALHSQMNSLNQKVIEKQKEVKQLNTEKQELLDSRIDRFEFNSKVTPSNNQSNPLVHRFPVPKSSKVDVYLYNLASDADFDVVNESGQVLSNSGRTRSGNETEVMDNFLINSSGSYFVRIWLHSGNETNYSLRVYRYS